MQHDHHIYYVHVHYTYYWQPSSATPLTNHIDNTTHTKPYTGAVQVIFQEYSQAFDVENVLGSLVSDTYTICLFRHDV